MTKIEKQFLCLLLRGNAKEYMRKTPKTIVDAEPVPGWSLDLMGMELTITERESEIPHTAKAGIPPVVMNEGCIAKDKKAIVETLISG